MPTAIAQLCSKPLPPPPPRVQGKMKARHLKNQGLPLGKVLTLYRPQHEAQAGAKIAELTGIKHYDKQVHQLLKLIGMRYRRGGERSNYATRAGPAAVTEKFAGTCVSG